MLRRANPPARRMPVSQLRKRHFTLFRKQDCPKPLSLLNYYGELDAKNPFIKDVALSDGKC